jgi:hypothetical protein
MHKVSASVMGRSQRSPQIIIGLFFTLLFLLGLGIYRDYNISWDEPIERNTGMVSLKYVGEIVAPNWVAKDSVLGTYTVPLHEYHDRDYGTAFQLPVSYLERVFGLVVARDIFMFRHLLTFVVCFGGIIAVFKLIERRFSDWRIGVLGALWLVLSPRLFSDFFFNSKDAVFLAVFAIGTNTAVRFLLRPTIGRACWHALACAVAIDVRIMGIILPAVTITLLLLRMGRNEVAWRRALLALVLYLVLTGALVVTIWPYLWAAPWENFQQAFANMSKFRWNGTVLYRGELLPAADLPWHYIPLWISISTPFLYLGCFIAGVGGILFRLIQRNWRLWQGDEEWQDLLFLALFVGPILAVIVLHSVVYDGWRQLYFVYPAFLLVALRGWHTLWRWCSAGIGQRWPLIVGGLTFVALSYTAFLMIRSHPLQNVYFNSLAGRDVKKRFEVDYWGMSNLKSLQYIAAHDDRPLIKVWPASSTPLAHGVLMLKKRDRVRFQVVEYEQEADYVISNYRGHPEGYDYRPAVYQSIIGGEIINSVFKRGDW